MASPFYPTLGLKRYAQTTIQYDTRYGAHDTICSAIHLPFLAGKQRLVIPACNQKHSTSPITTACAVMMRNGYNNGGLLRISRCSVFVMNLHVLLEYTGCYLQYLMLLSNFGMCYNCTVSSSERIAICTVASVLAVNQCAGVSFQPYPTLVPASCWMKVRIFLHLSSSETRTTRTPAFWGYPHRLMISHTIESYWIPSQKKTKSKLQV